MNALERLKSTLASLRKDVPIVRVGGIVSEVAATHFRVSGLSRFVKLGELIGLEIEDRVQLGEVVRIDSNGVTAKPFNSHVAAGLGLVAYRLPPATLSPHPSWKGRVLNALGEPLDGAGPLHAGERVDVDGCGSAARDQPHPRARTVTDRRARGRPVHAALPRPTNRHLCRFGRRQDDIALHARPKPRDSTLSSRHWSGNVAARCVNFLKKRWFTISHAPSRWSPRVTRAR